MGDDLILIHALDPNRFLSCNGFGLKESRVNAKRNCGSVLCFLLMTKLAEHITLIVEFAVSTYLADNRRRVTSNIFFDRINTVPGNL